MLSATQRIKMNKMLDIEYKCLSCNYKAPDDFKSMRCPLCGGNLKGKGPGIMGTRDSFGVGRKFYHNDNGVKKEITTWKEWEKAGYKDPLESTTLSEEVKSGIKEKKEKIRYEKREKFTVKV